jgi:hypothetical protein
VAVVVLLLACCVGGFLIIRSNADNRAAGPAPSGSARTSAPAILDLGGYLLKKPAGATALPPSEGSSDGAVSITEAAKSYDDPSAGLDRLESLGYQQGAATAWQTSSYYLYASIYQLGTEAKATAWAAESQFAFVNSPDHQPGESLRDVPLGRAFARKAADENGYWYISVYFPKNNIAVKMFVATLGKADMELATKLAQDQFKALP